jgi:uncharacterized protein
MFVKIHYAHRIVVAVADSVLIGEKFTEGIKQLEVRVGFFKGDEVDRDGLIKLMRKFDCDDATFNIVGEESIHCGIDAGVISKEGVMKIEGVPVALGLF